MFRFSRLRLLQFSSSFILAIVAISLAAETTAIRGTVSDPSGRNDRRRSCRAARKRSSSSNRRHQRDGAVPHSAEPVTRFTARVSVPGFDTVDKAIDSTSNDRE